MKHNVILYAHGGSMNHGCEAIVRTTAQILTRKDLRLMSYAPTEDLRYGLEEVCQVTAASGRKPRPSPQFLRAYLALKLQNNGRLLDELSYFDLLATAARGDVALSIGGDNYCYGPAGAAILARYHTFLKKRGIKTVLWGCSVEPDTMDEAMRKDLSNYDLITARESISYAALRQINPHTILVPDPAFTLQRQPGIYPKGLGKHPYIGLNVSPLVRGLEKGDDITMENYRELIRIILETTDRDIALIPHVVWSHNNDLQPLEDLYEAFRHSGRVFLVQDQNCMQLKDIISGCEFYIGARTHSTIAAYSTHVPTLVVGYSVKARGIARDIFGTEEGYVLPVQQLREKDDLTNAFKALYSRKDKIRKHLSDMMPGYIHGTNAAKEAIEAL